MPSTFNVVDRQECLENEACANPPPLMGLGLRLAPGYYTFGLVHLAAEWSVLLIRLAYLRPHLRSLRSWCRENWVYADLGPFPKKSCIRALLLLNAPLGWLSLRRRGWSLTYCLVRLYPHLCGAGADLIWSGRGVTTRCSYRSSGSSHLHCHKT